MTLKDMIRLITPPVFSRRAKRLQDYQTTGAYGLSGDYRSWNEARSANSGYDEGIILEKTQATLLKVKKGNAAYERDSVLFDEIQYAWPLLAGLMLVAAKSDGWLLEELLREKYSIILRFGESTADIIKDQKIITAACFAQRLQ